MTFQNPVIPGSFPDPSICRVAFSNSLAVSSFTYFPGVPIFESANLTDWRLLGNALDRRSQLDLLGTDSWSSLGIYAPTLRHHNGKFWLITTNVTEARATSFIINCDDPGGPWSDPVTVDVPGIDPDLAWDDDGNCWMHFSGLGGIARARIDPTTGAVLEGPDVTWSGSGLQYPEAPHLQREGCGTWSSRRVAPSADTVSRWPVLPRRPGPGGCSRQPDLQSPEHRQPDSERGSRRPCSGGRRVLVDGLPGRTAPRHVPGLPRPWS